LRVLTLRAFANNMEMAEKSPGKYELQNTSHRVLRETRGSKNNGLRINPILYKLPSSLGAIGGQMLTVKREFKTCEQS
jgi:hypothetical protein